MLHMQADAGVVPQQQDALVALPPPHLRQEGKVLAKVDVLEPDLQGQLPPVDVGEAVAIRELVDQRVSQVHASRQPPSDGVAETPVAVRRAEDVPAGQLDRQAFPLLHCGHHGAQVVGRVEVVVVEVGHVGSGGQVRADVALDADGEVSARLDLYGQVDDPLILLGLLCEELRWLPAVGLDDDELLVLPLLLVEGPPQLLVEELPGLRRGHDD
mmetsp:Transcript_66341/g.209712  ORF Transcript_66341/g.209712 Transcript_66341/m.209712 type:complete len:213 (-) Transcript_66341:1948-2586(-)